MNLWKRLLNLIRKNPRSRDYQRWTEHEEAEILMMWREDDEALSKKLGRTIRAIREKRRRIK